MPSSVDPSTILTGPGKIHSDVVSAAADLYVNTAGGAISALASVVGQPLAAGAVTATFTAGGGAGDASKVLSSGSGPFYVGSSVSEDLQDLFEVVNASDDTAIFNSNSSSYVTVSGIAPASVGDGFYANNLTLSFSTPVPAGVQYKVFYGRRSTLGSFPVELGTFPTIRRSQNRVRFPEFVRTGIAPTSISNPLDIVALPYADPYMSQWRAVTRGSSPATLTREASGSAGFVNVNRKQNVVDINDVVLTGHQAAGFLSVYEKDIRATTLNGSVAFTKINSTLSATVNPGGAGGDIIALNAADYFRLTGPHRTAVRVGVDMLQITYPTTGLKEVFIIRTLNASDPTRAQLLTLGGAQPNFTTATVNAMWIRPAMFLGGDNDPAITPTGNFYKGFGHFVSGPIIDPGLEVEQTPPFFAAANVTQNEADNARASWNLKAFTWGGFPRTGSSVASLGQKTVKGELWGDGTIESYGGRIRGLLSSRNSGNPVVVTNGGNYDFVSDLESAVYFSITGSSMLTFTVGQGSTLPSAVGDRIVFFVAFACTPGSAAENSVFTWDAAFKFSGSDGIIASPAHTMIKYEGVGTDSGDYFMTRTDYIGAV